MRILICNWRDRTHPRAGGAETYTEEVMTRWAAQGHQVTLFTAAVAGEPADENRGLVRIVRQGSRHSVYRRAAAFIRRHAREYDLIIDEVNTRPFNAQRWAAGTPVVALIHQVCREIWRYEIPLPVALLGEYLFEPLWLRSCRDIPVLTVSESSRKSLVQYGISHAVVVPEGVHRLSRPSVEREPAPTVVFLGRLVPSKRPDHVVEAFRILSRWMPDARLWIVGDGPMRGRLEAIAPDSVTFFGRVSESRRNELLARAHAHVVSSVREGWALVVDEAAAMGTPTVAYNAPGLCDSVSAAAGVLTEPNPTALARALASHLPDWTAAPAPNGWRGGAVDWDVVAAEVLRHACAEFPRLCRELAPR